MLHLVGWLIVLLCWWVCGWWLVVAEIPDPSNLVALHATKV